MPESTEKKLNQEEKNILLLGLLLLFAVIAVLLDLFNREGDQKVANSADYLTSETDRENYLKALREGKSKVETEKGELAISS